MKATKIAPILAVLVLASAVPAIAQPASSSIQTGETPERFRRLLGKWELLDFREPDGRHDPLGQRGW